ncbi:MAG: hypothetical protein MUE78_06325, partial [Ilumatobacteraceae bacterium]|nr:hypothetical protein [Ilumatobacteraceae bacterium]
VLRAQPSVDLLDALVRNVPAGSTLVLIGRAAPPLSLARARVRPGVVDVTTAELALDAIRAREVVEAMGAELDDRMLDDVMRDTDGWPLGIRLVGSALAEGEVIGGEGPTADDAITTARSYAEVEWLRGLAPADADFLRKVSGLGWMSGALCDHVLEASDSGARLERLQSSGLLVAPLDRHGDSFRVHQVVRDSLDAALQRSDRQAHRRVHQRASDWFESVGEIDRAVDQALRADDVTRAGRLVVEHGALHHTRGRTQTVRRWLDELPKPHVLADPGLCLVAAVVSLGAGDGEAAAAWTRFGEHALASDRTECDSDIGARMRAMRSMLWIDPIEESLAMATQACDELPPGLWRAVACTTRGALSFALGDEPVAAAALAEGTAELHVVDAPTVEAIGLAHLAIVVGRTDEQERAVGLARSARRILSEHELEHMPTTALVTAVSALAEAADGDPGIARSEILLTRTHLAFLHSVADWHHMQARIALVRASMQLGDLVGARTLLRELECGAGACRPRRPPGRTLVAHHR